MKNLIIAGTTALIALPANVLALTLPSLNMNCCTMTCNNQGIMNPTYASSCTDPNVCNCSSSETKDDNGLIIRTTNILNVLCSINGNASAMCLRGNTTYLCDVGYYGNPTEDNPVCTRCPVVPANYLPLGTGTTYGTTAGEGAKSVTECYVPSTTFRDDSGSGTLTGNCYYALE